MMKMQWITVDGEEMWLGSIVVRALDLAITRGAFSFKVPARLPAGAAFSRTACRRLPAGRLLVEQAVKRADWWAWLTVSPIADRL